MVGKIFRLLFVEDNEADLHLMKQLLRTADFAVEVSAVGDGDQALAFLRQEEGYTTALRPDLIFLDLNLPRVTGREVLQVIKTDPKLREIPVLIFSSSSSPKDVRETYALGANAFVCKPVALEQIEEMLKNLLQFWLHTATLT